jgi:Insertion element 4 transposase N-terminal/Transposase DDE domain
MERSLRQVDPTVHWTQEATLETLSRVITRERVETILKALKLTEIRVRKLTMVVTIWLCIAMNFYTEESIDDVMVKLAAGPRFLRPVEGIDVAGASAISQRRQQLGVAPMVTLFRDVCHPLATTQTRDAFLFGLRLMAVDGTVEDVADTPANASYFGRQTGSRGDSAFPQMRCVYLCECGTHAICDAGVWPYQISERKGGLRVLRSVGPDMLVMWDRGFHSFDMCSRCYQQNAAFLGRVPSHVRFTPASRLPDGSYLAYIRPSEYKRRKAGERLLVRVIEYTINDPARTGHGLRHRLVTSLLDPVRYPAHELAVAYHERWEVEITIDETDTHQRQALRPFRSRTPLGVLQEFYGLLLAHYLIRATIHEAALQAEVAPDRLSFVHSVRILRSAVFPAQIVAPEQSADWYQQLLHDIGQARLPQRDNRINPRVIKRKMSKFALKREEHRHLPQPARNFSETVVILI